MISALSLRQVQRWQTQISYTLQNLHPALTAEGAQQQSCLLLLVLLTFKRCEQQGLLSPAQLALLQEDRLGSARLLQLHSELNARFDSLIPASWVGALQWCDESFVRLAQSHLEWLAQPIPIPIALLGQLYEQSLLAAQVDPTATSKSFKKRHGVYYTPDAIAQFIAHQALNGRASMPDVVSQPQILDLACGCGALLLQAYQWLLMQTDEGKRVGDIKASEAQDSLAYPTREAILLNSIFGVDLDNRALEVAKLSLTLMLIGSGTPTSSYKIPDLNQNLRCGNSLIAPINEAEAVSSRSIQHPLDWETAFPQLGRSPQFDVILGNPPYVDSECMSLCLPDWRHYLSQHYQTARGNWDLFCVFIEKAINLCKPGGLISFIVPNKLISSPYAAPVRSLLASQNRLISLRDYSRVPVFRAAIYPVVFLTQKQPERGILLATSADAAMVRYEQMSTLSEPTNTVDLPYSCCADPAQSWALTSPALVKLAEKLSTLPLLSEIATICGAATVAEAYALRSLICEQPSPQPGDLKLVNSGTLDRYTFLWGNKPIRYLKMNYRCPVIPLSRTRHLPPTRFQQATQPKIIVAGLSQRLECALDLDGGVMPGKSTSIITRLRPSIDWYCLLGLLNSTLLSLFCSIRFDGNRLQGGYLRIGPPQLRQLPIYVPTTLADQEIGDAIAQHVKSRLLHSFMLNEDQHLETARNFAAIDQTIDELVYDLYRLSHEERAIARDFALTR